MRMPTCWTTLQTGSASQTPFSPQHLVAYTRGYTPATLIPLHHDIACHLGPAFHHLVTHLQQYHVLIHYICLILLLPLLPRQILTTKKAPVKLPAAFPQCHILLCCMGITHLLLLLISQTVIKRTKPHMMETGLRMKESKHLLQNLGRETSSSLMLSKASLTSMLASMRNSLFRHCLKTSLVSTSKVPLTMITAIAGPLHHHNLNKTHCHPIVNYLMVCGQPSCTPIWRKMQIMCSIFSHLSTLVCWVLPCYLDWKYYIVL